MTDGHTSGVKGSSGRQQALLLSTQHGFKAGNAPENRRVVSSCCGAVGRAAVDENAAVTRDVASDPDPDPGSRPASGSAPGPAPAPAFFGAPPEPAAETLTALFNAARTGDALATDRLVQHLYADPDVLRVHEALDELAQIDARLAQVLRRRPSLS